MSISDLRGETMEIEIKEDKQGVGMTKRSTKGFEARQMGVMPNSYGLTEK
jgi:hypothetical protein